jgi:cytidyltransferase-like protein
MALRRRIAVGSVHGRFQPLHLGHMEYLERAAELADYLFIGLTQPDVRALRVTTEARHRSEAVNNPLTFFERMHLITEALDNVGIDKGRFSIIPFPIETPEALPDYLPIGITCFTTIVEDWNRLKIERLRAVGYHVEVLWERTEKAYRGETVRRLIQEGDQRWKSMVPVATVRAIERLRLAQRLAELESAEAYQS